MIENYKFNILDDDLNSHKLNDNCHVKFGKAESGYYALTINNSVLWFDTNEFIRLDTNI
jgi:hypothetical protein